MNTEAPDIVKKDLTDRYGKLSGVKGIPSGFTVVIRNGKAAALASAGGSIITEDDLEKESGLDLTYWIERSEEGN